MEGLAAVKILHIIPSIMASAPAIVLYYREWENKSYHDNGERFLLTK